jgi:cobyrinic acid a,c-diamide synthase
MPTEIERLYGVNRGGVELGAEGYRYRNCLASYIHLHFGSCPGMAAELVASCRKFKNRNAYGPRKSKKGG